MIENKEFKGHPALNGADLLSDLWKNIPVNNIALYIEKILYFDTQWVIFEPNNETLWSKIRL